MICECGHDEKEHESLGCMHEFPNKSFCACVNNPYSFSIKTDAQVIATLRQRVAELEAANAQAKFDTQAAIIDVRRMEAHNTKQSARIAELEAEQAIVTPNNCRHCHRAAEKMREAAAVVACDLTMYYTAAAIRSLPLPACDGCNPLAPVVCNDVLHKCAVCGNDADGPFYCADCK